VAIVRLRAVNVANALPKAELEEQVKGHEIGLVVRWAFLAVLMPALVSIRLVGESVSFSGRKPHGVSGCRPGEFGEARLVLAHSCPFFVATALNLGHDNQTLTHRANAWTARFPGVTIELFRPARHVIP
jgi:hypothetical protein